MIIPVLLGIVGAAFLGTGFVVQQREAAQVAPDDSFSVRLLWALVRRTLWWSGIASMAVGYVLVGLSLGTGNLVLVEPLIAANLVFALPVAAAWCRRLPQRRSMLGAVALAAGVAGFVLAAQPNGGRSDNVPVLNWAIAAAVAGAVIAGAVAAAWRRHGDSRALLLGIATGTAYGMQDGLTRDVYGAFSHAGAGAFGSWQVWTLVVVGAIGVMLAQNAFDCAPLTSSLPAISIMEPFVGIVLGVALFDSHLRTSWPAVVVAGASLVVMFAGAYLVSRARVVREATTPRRASADLRRAA
jgi:drug/metabolite transporter (DMT)-like permease